MSEWYFLFQNDQKGPIPLSALKELFDNGTLPSDALIWTEGMDTWAPSNQVAAFSSSPSTSFVEATHSVEPASLPQAKEGPGISSPQLTKREELKVPLWVKLSAVFVAGVVIYSSAALPWQLPAAFYYERGQQAETQKNYEEAARDYQLSLSYCARSPVVLGRLGVVSVYRSDKATVESVMNRLEGVGPADNGDIMKARLEILTAQKGQKP
jgi:hypothetical protein